MAQNNKPQDGPSSEKGSVLSDASSLQDIRREYRKGSVVDVHLEHLPLRDTFRKSSLDIQMKHLQEQDLFKQVTPSDEKLLPKRRTPSWLLAGFTMRNKASLEQALRDDRRARTKTERQLAMQRLLEEQRKQAKGTVLSDSESSSTVETMTQSTVSEPSQGTKQQISYLMGLEEPVAEEYEPPPFTPKLSTPSSLSEDLSLKSGSLAMRKANKYLRSHKIFEFFQCLIAHLLSARPSDPITFFVDLLDKCLIYRSGLGCPPLLYNMVHLEQIFFLMDRMETGFIEVSQYKTGMQTLGICSYNTKPTLSPDGMVAKDFFLTEAYDCLTSLFNDMIRIRRDVSSTPEIPAPPPSVLEDRTTTVSLSYDSSSGSNTPITAMSHVAYVLRNQDDDDSDVDSLDFGHQ